MLWLSFALPLALPLVAEASSGDRLPEFRSCVRACVDQCPHPLGLLPLMLWDCESDCDYTCQQVLTKEQLASNAPLHQYHGKWPFVRMLGIQEPASVVFSILNFAANYYGVKAIAGQSGDMSPYYTLFAYVGMNTWVWSTVFHIRDFILTERLDYFSAIASILYGLFMCCVRVFRLYDYPKRQKMLASVLLAYYAYHVSYLSFVRFDYAYNMLVGVVAGIAQNVLWIYLSVANYRASKDVRDLYPIALVLAVVFGMSFELLDFSPIWLIFDAHSLWHAATVLPTYCWYHWMRHDLQRGTTRRQSHEKSD